MLMRPIVERLLAAVRSRFKDDLQTDWIVPRAERGETALSIVVRAAGGPGLFDGTRTRLELVATCAVAGSDDAAFARLDRLQHAVSTLAADPPALDSRRIVRAELRGMEWGEAEQGDVRLCEVRLLLEVVDVPG